MDKILHELSEWARLGLLAAFGGAASYVYIMVTKNRKFVWWMFLANLFIAFFAGKAIGGFIPEDSKNYTGWVMMLGFCAYPVLGLIEAKILQYIDRRTLPGGP